MYLRVAVFALVCVRAVLALLLLGREGASGVRGLVSGMRAEVSGARQCVSGIGWDGGVGKASPTVWCSRCAL